MPSEQSREHGMEDVDMERSREKKKVLLSCRSRIDKIVREPRIVLG